MTQYLTADDIAAVLRAEGDAAVSGRTVHYYAEQRVLPPPEYDGSRPRYTHTHLAAMRRARELKRQGYTLQAIEEMVATPAPSAPAIQRKTPAPPAPAPPMAQAPRSPAPDAPMAQAPRSPASVRTLVVAPGLTLSALGWDDRTLNAIVQAIRTAIETERRADARERDDHDTPA